MKVLPFLERYPNRLAVLQLRDGFGFKIPSMVVALGLEGKNLDSAYVRPEIVSAKFPAEVKLGKVVGPFSSPPFED